MGQKFKTREELEEYVKNNRTPFSEFEKRLDYSKFTKSQEKKKSPNKTLWRRIGYALASVVLVVVTVIGVVFGISGITGNEDCPFEMGTYVYESHRGNLEETGFNEESYIVLTEEELSGPGTFNIKDEKNKWSVYGQFYNCEWNDRVFDWLEKMNKNYYFSSNEFITQYKNDEDTFIAVGLKQNGDQLIKFIKI